MDNIGGMNVITGVPTRIGAPVEDIVKVNTELSQRYLKNQSDNFAIHTALSNIPLIAPEVDNATIKRVSDKVNDNFKSIIENDNWEDATNVVTKTVQEVTNDAGLKALQTNTQKVKDYLNEIDERIKADPKNSDALRKYKEVFLKPAIDNYKKQGGSLSADGVPQTINIYTPKTNMDTSEETKALLDLVGKMKSWTESRELPIYYDKQSIELIKDPVIREVMRTTLKGKTRIETSTLTKERIGKMAEDYITSQPMFNTKLQEISLANHILKTGRAEVLPEDLKDLAKNELSPTLLKAILISNPSVKSLINQATDVYNKNVADKNKHAAEIFSNTVSKIYNNKELLNSSLDLLVNIATDDKDKTAKINKLTNIYFGTLQNNIKEQTIAPAYNLEEKSVKTNTEFFANSLIDILSKQKEKDEKEPQLAFTTDGTTELTERIQHLDENSDANKKLLMLENIKDTQGLDENQLAQYNAIKASQDATVLGLKNAYYSLPVEDRNKIISNSYSLWRPFLASIANTFKAFGANVYGSDGKAMFSKDKPTPYTPAYNEGYEVESPDMKAHNKVLSILSSLKPEDLFLNNGQILSKAKGVKVTNSEKEIVFNALNKQRHNFLEAISKQTISRNGTVVIPRKELVTTGRNTPTTELLYASAIHDLLKFDKDGNSILLKEDGTPIKAEDLGMNNADFENVFVKGRNEHGVTLSIVNYGIAKDKDTKTLALSWYTKPESKGSTKSSSELVNHRIEFNYVGNDATWKAAKSELINSQKYNLNDPQRRNLAIKTVNTFTAQTGSEFKDGHDRDINSILRQIITNGKFVNNTHRIFGKNSAYDLHITGVPGNYKVDLTHLVPKSDGKGNTSYIHANEFPGTTKDEQGVIRNLSYQYRNIEDVLSLLGTLDDPTIDTDVKRNLILSHSITFR